MTPRATLPSQPLPADTWFRLPKPKQPLQILDLQIDPLCLYLSCDPSGLHSGLPALYPLVAVDHLVVECPAVRSSGRWLSLGDLSKEFLGVYGPHLLAQFPLLLGELLFLGAPTHLIRDILSSIADGAADLLLVFSQRGFTGLPAGVLRLTRQVFGDSLLSLRFSLASIWAAAGHCLAEISGQPATGLAAEVTSSAQFLQALKGALTETITLLPSNLPAADSSAGPTAPDLLRLPSSAQLWLRALSQCCLYSANLLQASPTKKGKKSPPPGRPADENSMVVAILPALTMPVSKAVVVTNKCIVIDAQGFHVHHHHHHHHQAATSDAGPLTFEWRHLVGIKTFDAASEYSLDIDFMQAGALHSLRLFQGDAAERSLLLGELILGCKRFNNTILLHPLL
jgi:hypothetical protein